MHEGNNIAYSLTLFALFCELSYICAQQRCIQERQTALAHSGVGRYVPECENNGDYKPKQCHFAIGQCWCATADGERIPGTSGPGFDDDQISRIDCNAERQRFQQTLGAESTNPGALGSQNIFAGSQNSGCPPAIRGRTCSLRNDLCQGDASCSKSQKCCFNGCFNECQWTNGVSSSLPDLGPSSSISGSFGFPDHGSKPGQCPSANGFGSCLQSCQADANCPSSQKCCFNGCGRDCRTPAGIDVGSFGGSALPGGSFGRGIECPSPSSLTFGSCSFACQDDSNCSLSQRCCLTSCGGRDCISTSTASFGGSIGAPFASGSVRPGNCPRPIGATICINQCVSDNECPRLQKCCSNGCGHVCTSVADAGNGNALSGDACSSNPCPVGQLCRNSPIDCIQCPQFECISSGAGSLTTQCSDANAQFSECDADPNCAETCSQTPFDNNNNNERLCSTRCTPGCVCRAGFVRRSIFSDVCIARAQCLNGGNGFDRPGAAGFPPSSNNINQTPAIVTQAVAILTPSIGSNVQGQVTFTQLGGTGPLSISGTIQGLAPGKHGMHIHELGDLTNGCASTGTHYNPTNSPHGGPNDFSRHLGDLGNLNAEFGGQAQLNIQDSKLSLNGVNSIVGRALAVHENADDLGTGTNEESRKTGNSGARVSCAIVGIKLTQPLGDLFFGR